MTINRRAVLTGAAAMAAIVAAERASAQTPSSPTAGDDQR